ncbi:MAG: cobalamin biosynthesis protein CobD [Prevotella sp.]|nr:cobalamin biosynthesis protein CobD [Prevotella sp.]MBO5157165.1 cobalamin biosynthesis protein CobD [Prevotella sp.]
MTELILGWILDLIFGDPARLPHPVVAFGKWIAMLERRLNKGSHRRAKGAAVAVVSIALTFGIIKLLELILSPQPSFNPQLVAALHSSLFIFHSSLIFFCLAGTTLRREVRMVFTALDRSLDDGRRQVSRIVGRDTSALSAQEVRTAALETLAENLSDGVVAPLFWLCLLGVPGMMAYKMVNTLDSMIGYRNERYKDFGCWAAKIDDIANWLPSRITAFAIVIAGWGYSLLKRSRGIAEPHRKSLAKLAAFVMSNGPRHASPNSGWPEAALAATLDCRFGGPHLYFGQMVEKPFIGSNPRALSTHDMTVSLRVCMAAEALCVAAAILILYI